MEFAGKAIVTAAFVVTLTLIYRYYRVRSANVARTRDLGDSECRESAESPEKSTLDPVPLPSFQSLSSQGNVSDPTRQINAGKQEETGLKTLSVDKAADIRCSENLQTTGELNNGIGKVKSQCLWGKRGQSGASGLMSNCLAESRGKDPTPNKLTCAASGVRGVRNFQAEQSNKTKHNQRSGADTVESKSGESDQTVGEEDYSNSVRPQTGREQELDASHNGEPRLRQNVSAFDVVIAGNDPNNIGLFVTVTESLQDLLLSPASDAVKGTQYKTVDDQPSKHAENEMLEALLNGHCTAGSTGEHENSSSACKIYPDIIIQRSNTPSVQSAYQVKHEEAQVGNGSEGRLNVLQLCVGVNHKTVATSEMAGEVNEQQDGNNTCLIAQITTDQVRLDTANLNNSAFQNRMTDLPEVYCSSNAIQDNIVPSQSLTVEPKVVGSSLSDLSPPEHPETSNILYCPTESDIKIIMEERIVSRKLSISVIAETPEFLIDFQSEAQTCSEGSISEDFHSQSSSLADVSSISLGCLVDSLYLSQPDLSKETTVEIVARANFIPIPLSNQSTAEVMKCRLDLGNCYEILCVAKKHDLKDLKGAAYQVMSDNYLQVLKNPSIYGQLKADERELILSRRMLGTKYLMVADVDVQENAWTKAPAQHNVKGETTGRSLKRFENNHKVYYYKNDDDSWYPLVELEVESISKDCALCTMYNYLFVVAGCQGSGKGTKLSNKVFCYNPVTNIWSEISPLNQARPKCKLVALDGYLYAIGGECLCTVEKYDPRKDRWTFTAPLPRGIFAATHKATVCNGEIYVIRGISYNQLLKYNPRDNSWDDCIMMSKKDKTTDIAAVKNFVYRFEINRESGVSVFRYHIITKTACECASKQLRKMASFQCAVMDDTIYCINKQCMMQFVAREMSPYFKTEDRTVLPGARGILFPFVLTLPDGNSLQTQV
ncbi:kelch domain-containing protein 7A [Amblyraja radiata]|uniref:kelch domain-containing protein 7A n=1 Tax=Amblyraja radiata TaxID=386614 RepID=UPI0014026D3E|nr:kelch domain-containing protein 7A [Amblyraja radiata]